MAARFSPAIVRALDQGKILGIRAGSEPHRFIGIWVVVVEGRVFVRSWDRKPQGWYHTFGRDRSGVIQVGKRQLDIRASPTRSERLRDLVDQAYRNKYNTPGSLKYVRGFARAARRDTTTELLPASRVRLARGTRHPRTH
ncbi:MAG TPA: DUF2255 family protein [Gemmatimonadales bacterium]|jgi:hypothetical protein|nr:DUF2255 family protein [Gemmatimonadales bacterium]